MKKIRSSEITPEHIYMSRRRFVTGTAKLLAGTALLAACGGATPGAPEDEPPVGLPAQAPDATPVPPTESAAEPATSEASQTDELGNLWTPYESVVG